MVRRAALLICLIAGCAPSLQLTTTGPKQPSRGKHCEFQVLTAAPAGGFVEIGTIDYEASTAWTYSTTLDDFRTRIEPLVCDAGGDAAVALKNGIGLYIQATVLKTTSQTAAASANAQSVQPGNAEGCRFDTQCKGDRICVSGACVDAQKK